MEENSGKKIYLFVAILILIFAISMVSYFVFFQDHNDADGLPIIDDPIVDGFASSSVEVVKKEGDKKTKLDPEIKKNNEFYRLAESSGDVNDCEKISKERSRDFCIKNLTVESGIFEDCNKIIDNDIQESCFSETIYFLAVDQKNIAMCEDIDDKNLLQSCIVFLVSSQDDCMLLSDNLQLNCLNIIYNNSGDCDNISDEGYRWECLSGMDSDNDGLNDAREEELGTNRNNSDTDGDGYLDGAEVDSGHDPLH